MPAYKLIPACKDYLWGGNRIKTDYNITSDCTPLAEAGMLSCHPDGPSVPADGPAAGQTLPEYIAEHPGCLGTNCSQFSDFPLLVKLIDAKNDLSIQMQCKYFTTDCLNAPFMDKVNTVSFAGLLVIEGEGGLRVDSERRPIQKGDCFFLPACSGDYQVDGPAVVLRVRAGK